MRILILGVTGQDGSYLAEFLLQKGHEVHGLIRRTSTGNRQNISHIEDSIKLHDGDITDFNSLFRVIDKVRPDEIYNQADQDHAGWSWNAPDYSYSITGASVGKVLECIRKINPKIKFLQPISSNIFGEALDCPQDENTYLNPRSPYACAKAMALYIVRMYRALGLFASTAILYNHESVRRTEEYVTRKISKSVGRILRGEQKKLVLGDLKAKIDWGWSPEYVQAEYQILQHHTPDDFIISSGELHTVEEFVEEAFNLVKLNWKNYVEVDESLIRPLKNSSLVGNYKKANKAFGFEPKVKFKEIVKRMVEYDSSI